MEQKLTYEQKKQAVQIAIDGGDPLAFLAKCGSANPVKMWGHIRGIMKEKEPELFAQIPDRRTVKSVQEQVPAVKIDGAIQIETPEANKVEVVETPERKGRYQITALVISGLGEFYHDRKYNRIDWRTEEGDEISLDPTNWRILAKEIPVLMQKLGVTR